MYYLSFCCETDRLRSEMLPFKLFFLWQKKCRCFVNWNSYSLSYSSRFMIGLIPRSSPEQQQNWEPRAETPGSQVACLSLWLMSGHLSQQVLWNQPGICQSSCDLAAFCLSGGFLRVCFCCVVYWLSVGTVSRISTEVAFGEETAVSGGPNLLGTCWFFYWGKTCFLRNIFYWSIVDYNVIFISDVQQNDSVIYTDMYGLPRWLW